MARDDFPKAVILLVAQRAGNFCSNPDCRRPQLAPAAQDAERVVHTGKAAHITAASEGGPRYDRSLSSAQRKSIQNAIYLCAVCADLIDKNDGVDHPAPLLHSWKTEHENWVRRSHNKDLRLLKVGGKPISLSPKDFRLGDGPIKAVQNVRVTNRTNEVLYNVWLEVRIYSSQVTSEHLRITPPKESRGTPTRVGTDQHHLIVSAESMTLALFDPDSNSYSNWLMLVALEPRETLSFVVENNFIGILSPDSHIARVFVKEYSFEPAPVGQIIEPI
jgi:hypothetical protein